MGDTSKTPMLLKLSAIFLLLAVSVGASNRTTTNKTTLVLCSSSMYLVQPTSSLTSNSNAPRGSTKGALQPSPSCFTVSINGTNTLSFSTTRTSSNANSTSINPARSQSTPAPSSTSVVPSWSKWNVTCKEGGCCDEKVAFNKNYTQRRTCVPAGSSCPSDAYGKNLTRSISCPKKTYDCDGCKSGAANIQALAGLVSTMLAMALVLWL